jgi:beta propeller repeat protein
MKRTVTLLGCAVVVLTAALAGSAEAADWTFATITINTHNDTEPRVSGSYVVWQGFVGGNDAEVMFHDIDAAGITQVTDNAVQDYEPRASASHVVWYEFQHGEIYAWPVGDPVVHTSISDSAYYNNMPRISGSHVVWQGEKDGVYDLFVYDLDTENLVHLDLNSPGDLYPNISGSTVVYQTGAAGATEVYLYDASEGGGPVLLAANAKYPKVSGAHAIWQGLGGNEVFLCEITDATPGAVRQLTGSAASVTAPQIAGSRVVWESDADGDQEIILYNIASDVTTQITDNTGTDAYPQISESLVAWRWRSGAQYAVFAYVFDDPQAEPEQLAAVNAKPQVSGSCVVWGASDGNDGEIYLAEALSVNQRPVADAGQDQTAHPADEVTLDGSGSSDPDEHYPLTYAWEIVEKPDGSAADLADPTSVSPAFTVDEIGDYRVCLVVTDDEGLASAPDEVLVSTFNAPPVAEAGDDQSVLLIGSTVQLDGTQSYDDDGDDIAYAWTIITKPEGSQAVLSDAASPTPTFVADVHGDYVVELTVSDPWDPSSPDRMTVSFANVKPVAVASGSQAVLVGETVTLDASGSSDANDDPLTFRWSLTTKPEGSAAELSDPEAIQTSFFADAPGTYVVSLVANDGFQDSDPDNVTIEAITVLDAAVEELLTAVATINDLDPSDFRNRRMAKILVRKISIILRLIDRERYYLAIFKLRFDVLRKMDGCANSGAPDRNDWLRTCEAQEAVYPSVTQAIELLGDLVP